MSDPIARIMVGVDGLPEGQDAIALAELIARATQGELILVSVHPHPLVLVPEESDWTSLEEQAVTMLSEARDRLAPGAKIAVRTDVSTPRALERAVRIERCDLLVVGSSRHGTDGRVRIGKRTRQLLSQMKSPLAIAPRGMRNSGQLELSRIGVGYDGGRESEAALALAAGLAQAAGAELRICSVVDHRVPLSGSSRTTDDAALRRWEERVRAEIDALRDFDLAAGNSARVPARAEVLRGHPADALLSFSERVDLLVIGSRRWGPFARLLLGSTGEALAHDAGCPLIIVPRPNASRSTKAPPTIGLTPASDGYRRSSR